MKRLLVLVVLAVLLALLHAPVSLAEDVVTKTDGAKLRGTVLLDAPDEVRIKTAGGVISIPRGEVAKVERAKDVFRELEDRKTALEKDPRSTSLQWLELARWCQDRELWVPSVDCFHEVVKKRDADNQDARFELGYRRLDDRWVPEAVYFEAKGYVQHEGRWIPKEEKEKLDQGLVKVGDDWVPAAEAAKREKASPKPKDPPPAAKGERKAPPSPLGRGPRRGAPQDSKWILTHSSKHYDFFSNGSLDEVKKLASTMDLMCDEYKRIFAYKPQLTRSFPVQLFASQQEFMARTGMGPGVGGFYDGERIVGFHGNLGSLTPQTVLFHEGTHQFQGLVFGENMWRAKIWFIEGLAVFFESSTIEGKKLNQQIPQQRLLQVKRAIQSGSYVKLADLIRMEQREFGALHYAHAWSLIYFLCNGTKGGLERFKKYFEGVKEGKDGVKLFEELFDKPMEEIESAWKAFVLAM